MREDEILARWEAVLCCGGPDTGCMSHPDLATSHGPRCAAWSGHPDHVHDTIARLTRERDEARAQWDATSDDADALVVEVNRCRAEVERLRAGLGKIARDPAWTRSRDIARALLASAETEATDERE